MGEITRLEHDGLGLAPSIFARIDFASGFKILAAFRLGSVPRIWLLIPPSAPAPSAPPAAACGSIVLGRLGGTRTNFLLGLFFEKGLTICDRNLIVVRMNFRKG
jgi:hypothetical protein